MGQSGPWLLVTAPVGSRARDPHRSMQTWQSHERAAHCGAVRLFRTASLPLCTARSKSLVALKWCNLKIPQIGRYSGENSRENKKFESNIAQVGFSMANFAIILKIRALRDRERAKERHTYIIIILSVPICPILPLSISLLMHFLFNTDKYNHQHHYHRHHNRSYHHPS